VGYFAPLTLGVGYTNIEDILNGHLTLGALAFLCVMKFISWSVSLSSGTSGGTLAPLFTIGGALGAMAGICLSLYFPGLGIDPRIAALVGMAAIFAGASRALFTTVIFAFETTGQPAGLLPLLGACTAAYLVSAVLMRNTIMTEKIVRRGVRVPSEYKADYLERVLVGDVCETDVVTLSATQTLGQIHDWIAQGRPESQHQGYPVMDASGRVLGVLTRRTFFDPGHLPSITLGELIVRPPVAVTVQNTLREAADHMVFENVGRLLVVDPAQPGRLLGMLTRGDLISAHGRRLREGRRLRRHLSLKAYRRMRRMRRSSAALR
jgi:CBS domain-containing protein